MRTISVCVLSHFNYIQPCATPWTIAQQAPLSMDFPSKNTGLACPVCSSPGISSNQGSDPCFLCLLYLRQSLYHWASGKPWKPFFRNMLKSPLKKEVIMWQISWFILSLLIFISYMDFPGGSDGKASDYNAGDPWIWSLGQEDPLEKEMATHSSILAWKIPWKADPGVSPTNDTIVMSCVLNPYNCHRLHHRVLEYLCVKDS